MILSVSRRTDIPNYYSDWFMNRILEKVVYVQNPMNPHQISKIDISPEVVDCIVFWTKNPEKMISKLNELNQYKYYFQFALTGYSKDIEPNLPNKPNYLISTFQNLSELIGSGRVIWRYDPIFLNSKYTIEYHLTAFEKIADSLQGYTHRVVISFLDIYQKIQNSIQKFQIKRPNEDEIEMLAETMAKIARKRGMAIETCAEAIDLHHLGVQKGCCIDLNVIEKIVGYKIKAGKDKNQRKECGCIESIDIGTYDTCRNGCVYCYANSAERNLIKKLNCYNVSSPLLCGKIGPRDKITERKIKQLKIVCYDMV